MQMYDVARLNAVPISAVVERFDTLRRSGCRKVAHCPWHEDHHPSLTLYETGSENRCYCFACQKGGSVLDYVMQQTGADFPGACEWVSREFGIDGKSSSLRPWRRASVPRPVQVQEPYVYVPREYMQGTVSAESSFCKCLSQLFGGRVVEHLVEEYSLGVCDFYGSNDDTLFWSIDRDGNVCNGKVQRYVADMASPAFAHSVGGIKYWIGSRLQCIGLMPNGRLNNKCLFGEHLLARYPQSVVALVESPKNALVGAACFPEYVWIAAGNSGNKKREVMSVLRGRQVVVYPDRDATSAWKQNFAGMKDIADFVVSDFCEKHAPPDMPKADIADLIIADMLR